MVDVSYSPSQSSPDDSSREIHYLEDESKPTSISPLVCTHTILLLIKLELLPFNPRT